jgi:hypothetical protein
MNLITGDLLAIESGTILHQVNCRGALGGLAWDLYHKYPGAFTDYFMLCDKYGAQNIGSACEGHPSKSLSIVHVFGQVEPGPGTNPTAVSLAIESLVGRPLLAPLYAPFRMGCGLGGGDWLEYEAILERNLPDLIIVQRPEDAP